jgi:uncharacterized protein YecT (DUF1311 family)
MTTKAMLAGLAAALCLGLATGARADCSANPSGEEAKTCLADELRAAAKRIDQSYKILLDAMNASERANLEVDQWDWRDLRDDTCGLPDIQKTDQEKWIQAALADENKTACVARFTFGRVAELNTLMKAKAPDKLAGLPAAPASPPPVGHHTETPSPEFVAQHDGYGLMSVTGQRAGRFYYEVWIDRDAIAARGDVLIHSGYYSTQNDTIFRATNIRRGQKDTGPLTIGWAIDLQKGYAYVRQNGEWRVSPGSEDGAIAKLNREWRAGLRSSVELFDLIKSGLVRINLVGPFEYPPPDGYRPFAAK